MSCRTAALVLLAVPLVVARQLRAPSEIWPGPGDAGVLSARDPTVFVQGLLPLSGGMPSLEKCIPKMDALYGKEMCVHNGDANFITTREAAPPDFCRRAVGRSGHILPTEGHRLFDQFSMERLVLGKWSEFASAASESCGPDCKRSSDIVVVPSLELHFRCSKGWNWGKMLMSQTMPDHRRYWALIRDLFYTPRQKRPPLIVVHSSFVNGSPKNYFDGIFQALSEMPVGMIRRVVIASIESNLRANQHGLFGQGWSDGASAQLQRRLRNDGQGGDGPLLVTMPYPTSILRQATFLEDSGSYHHGISRRIVASMSVGLDRGEGVNWIRRVMTNKMQQHTRNDRNDGTYLVCDESGLATGSDKNCGVGDDPTMWDLVVNSAFCLEPAGDTLTRSHFYVALLSGCVPVIFDGGEEIFSGSTPTWWAWRQEGNGSMDTSGEDEPFVDFSEFAVVYNASQVQNENIDVVQDLQHMLANDPQRYAGLRRGLEQAAWRMRYSEQLCLGHTCKDAFSNFLNVLRPLAGDCVLYRLEHCAQSDGERLPKVVAGGSRSGVELGRLEEVKSAAACGDACQNKFSGCGFYSFAPQGGVCLLYDACPGSRSFKEGLSEGAVTKSLGPCAS